VAERLNHTERGHLSNEEIAAFIDHQVSSEELDAMIMHVADCPSCRELVARTTMSQIFVEDPASI